MHPSTDKRATSDDDDDDDAPPTRALLFFYMCMYTQILHVTFVLI